jgi:hypothetical protein
MEGFGVNEAQQRMGVGGNLARKLRFKRNKEGVMLNSKHFFRRVGTGAAVAVALAACVLVVDASVPRGWLLAGSKSAEYEVGVDAGQAYQAHKSAFLKSKQPSVEGFGTLMQQFTAEQYLGKKVRLSGVVKSDEVKGWAGLWMRVDRGKEVVAFDNMEDRAIKGTTDWQRYEVVLDVPKDATGISLGILLTNAGEVWLNSTKFETVASDVPTTNLSEKKLPDKPVNLEFTE